MGYIVKQKAFSFDNTSYRGVWEIYVYILVKKIKYERLDLKAG